MKALIIGLISGFAFGWWMTALRQTDKADSQQASPVVISLADRPGQSSNVITFAKSNLSQASVIVNAATWEPPNTSAGLLKALKSLEDVQDPMLREVLLTRIIGKWVKLDPQAGFNAILGQIGLPSRDQVLEEYVKAWAIEDAEGAIEDLRSFSSNEGLQRTLATKIIEVLSSRNPRQAVELVNEFNVYFHGGSAIEKAFRALAEESPRDAAELAFAVKDWQAQGWSVRNAYHAWSRSDPKAALQHLREQKVTDMNHGNGWWETIFNGWAESDPQAALAALGTEAPASQRQSLRNAIVTTWAQSTPEDAMAWLALDTESPTNHREFLRREIAKKWAGIAPEDAMAWVADIEDESERKQLYGELSSALAKEHPQMSLDALLASDQPNLGSNLFRTFAHEDWEGTMATLGQWEDAELRANAAETMLIYSYENGRPLGDDETPLLEWLSGSSNALSRGDPFYVEKLSEEGLAELSEQHPETYASLLPSIIHYRIDTDPEGVLDMVDQLDGEMLSRRGDDLRQRAVDVWARQEPRAAAEWAEALPEGSTRDYAFLNLTSAWASHDPEAALEWLNTLPATGARDFAAQAYAESTAGRDATSALAAAEMVVDADKRREILTRVWEQRLATEGETALEEMKNAGLPASIRDPLEAKANQEQAWQALGH